MMMVVVVDGDGRNACGEWLTDVGCGVVVSVAAVARITTMHARVSEAEAATTCTT